MLRRSGREDSRLLLFICWLQLSRHAVSNLVPWPASIIHRTPGVFRRRCRWPLSARVEATTSNSLSSNLGQLTTKPMCGSICRSVNRTARHEL
jgi:hypothetical protein